MAVDEKYKLSVEQEVTQAVTNQQQVVPMAARAEQTFGAEKREVVADMGNYDGAAVQECEAQGLIVDFPTLQTSANTKLGLFGKGCFTYDPEQDVDAGRARATFWSLEVPRIGAATNRPAGRQGFPPSAQNQDIGTQRSSG